MGQSCFAETLRHESPSDQLAFDLALRSAGAFVFHSDRCGKIDSAKMSRALLRLLPRLASSSAVAGPELLAAQSVLGRGRGAAAGRCFASDADLMKTPLYDLHVEHGGAMLLPSAFLPIH